MLALLFCTGCAAFGLYENITGEDALVQLLVKRYSERPTRYQDYTACMGTMTSGWGWEDMDKCMAGKGYTVKP